MYEHTLSLLVLHPESGIIIYRKLVSALIQACTVPFEVNLEKHILQQYACGWSMLIYLINLKGILCQSNQWEKMRTVHFIRAKENHLE